MSSALGPRHRMLSAAGRGASRVALAGVGRRGQLTTLPSGNRQLVPSLTASRLLEVLSET